MSRSDLYRDWLGVDFAGDQPNYYELLSLEMGSCSSADVEQAAALVLTKVRAVRPGEHAILWTRLLDEINQAKKTLGDESLREKYDQTIAATSPHSSTIDQSLTPDADQDLDPPGTHSSPDTGFKALLEVENSVEKPSGDQVDLLPPSKNVAQARFDRANVDRAEANSEVSGKRSAEPTLKMAVPLSDSSAAETDEATDDLSPPVATQTAPAQTQSEPDFQAVAESEPPEQAAAEAPVEIRTRKRKRAGSWLVPALGTLVLVGGIAGIVYALDQGIFEKQAGSVEPENEKESEPSLTSDAQKTNKQSSNQSPSNHSDKEKQDSDPDNHSQSNLPDSTLPESKQSNQNSNDTTEDSKNDDHQTNPDPVIPDSTEPATTISQQREFALLLRLAKQALFRRDTGRATDLLIIAAELPASKEDRLKAQRMELAVDQIESFWSLVAVSLPRFGAGENILINENEIGIVEATSDKLVIREAGRNRQFYFEDLPAGLAVAAGDIKIGIDDPDWNIAKAVFYWLESKKNAELIKRSRHFLDQASNDANVDDFHLLIDQDDHGNIGDISKSAIPEKSQVEIAQKAILSKSSIDALKSISAESAGELADQWLSEAIQSLNTTDRYSYFDLALQSALQSLDFARAIDVVHEMSVWFEIDQDAELSEVFKVICPKNNSQKLARQLCVEANLILSLYPDMETKSSSAIRRACFRMATRRKLDGWIRRFEAKE